MIMWFLFNVDIFGSEKQSEIEKRMNQVKSEIKNTRLKKQDQITKFTSQSRDTSKTQQRAMKDYYRNKK